MRLPGWYDTAVVVVVVGGSTGAVLIGGLVGGGMGGAVIGAAVIGGFVVGRETGAAVLGEDWEDVVAEAGGVGGHARRHQ